MITKPSAKPTKGPSDYNIIKLEILHFQLRPVFRYVNFTLDNWWHRITPTCGKPSAYSFP